MKTAVTIFAALFAFMMQGSFAETHAASVTGECTGMTHTRYVVSDVQNYTTSPTWVDLTDGRLSFTMTRAGCAIFTFSAPAFNQSDPGYPGINEVQIVLDGGVSYCSSIDHSNVFFGAESPTPVILGSITRICTNVAAGSHIVEVQFRTEAGSGGPPYHSVSFAGHVLTVTHP